LNQNEGFEAGLLYYFWVGRQRHDFEGVRASTRMHVGGEN